MQRVWHEVQEAGPSEAAYAEPFTRGIWLMLNCSICSMDAWGSNVHPIYCPMNILGGQNENLRLFWCGCYWPALTVGSVDVLVVSIWLCIRGVW